MAFHSPKEVAYKFCEAGVDKTKMPLLKFSILAILGGCYIAIGGLLSTVVAGGLPEMAATHPGLVKFIAGAVFPVGLIMVTVAGADLFTSDCTGLFLPYKQKQIKLLTVFKILGLSYLFNFIGAQIVAYFMAVETEIVTNTPWREYLHNIAYMRVNLGFYEAFLKGIGANWMVCLAVWMAFASRDIVSKCIVIWIPIMIFVTVGFEHSIANMFFIPAAIYSGAEITWWQFITGNLLPVTLGNIVAGVFFVGAIYWYVYMHGDSTRLVK